MSKFMTPQLGKQRIATNILSNISRNKGNQTIKFGQLIEHNMRNIFLEISCTKYGRETISRPFSKKIKIEPIWINSRKCYTICLLYTKLRAIKIY